MRIKEIPLLPELTEKFEANHIKVDGCWPWTGSVTGYAKDRGSLSKNIAGVRYCFQAHRYAYSLYVGPIPEGLEIDHLCQNPVCVNPKHLEPVTGAENKSREAARQTHCKRGHTRIPENTILGKQGNNCKPCMKAFARARKLGISTDEAVAREAELDKLYNRASPKKFTSRLEYKVDWVNNPHCRDCGHEIYSSAANKSSGSRSHAGKGRCWSCKNKYDKRR